MGFSFKSLFKAVVAAALVATGVGAIGLAAGGSFGALVAGSSAFGLTGLAAYVATSTLIAAATMTVSSLLAGTPPKFDTAGALRGQLITTRSPSDATRVVYGKTRLGGTMVYAETTGTNNENMHQAVVIAGHELNSWQKVYVNDESVPFSLSATNLYALTYKSTSDKIFVSFLNGEESPSSGLPALSGTSGSSYLFKGLATLGIKLVYDADVFPSGIPNITVEVEGKKVYDPRTSTTAYSNNAALCIRDYLVNTTYGLGASASEIDDTSFSSAANTCDENVNLAAGGTEKRYTINGAFSTAEAPKDILAKLLTACAGKLSYVGGKWTLKVGVYTAPSITLDEDDFVSSVTMQASQSRRDIFNAVKGIYSEPSELYQPISFPPVTNSTYEAEDGERIWKDTSFPFTTSFATCQRLARIELEKARQQITFTAACTLKAFALQPGDTVSVTFERYGWSSKVFEVLNWQFQFEDTDSGPTPIVNLVLRETASAIYDWDEDETAVDLAANTTLANPFSVSAPSSLTLTQVPSILDDGTALTALRVSWTAPTSSFIDYYEVQWLRSGSLEDWGLITAAATVSDNYGLITASADLTLDYGSVTDVVPSEDPAYNSVRVTGTQYTIDPATPGLNYQVRVRAVNSLGVRSSFSSTSSIAEGDTTAPGVPGGLTATAGFKQIQLDWQNPSDADLDVVEVYRSNTNSLSSATRIALVKGSKLIDAGLGVNATWYYWVRALDRSGNASAFTSGVNATTLFIDTPDFSQAVNNLFSEAGAYGIEPVSSLPATGDFDGQIKFNTTEVKLYRWDETNGVWTDDIFSIEAGTVDIASFAAGIEPVSIVDTLPTPSGYTGAKVVFLTTDSKLYRYTGSAWTSAIATTDLSGTLGLSQFSNSARPVEVVAALPTTDNFAGRMVFLTSDNKLYRHNGTSFTAAVSTTDLSGTVSDAQIAGLAASKVTGQLTNDQLEAIAAAKITGTITASQITDSAVTELKIASNAVTAAKIATSAVTAAKIDSAAVTEAKLASNAVTTTKISDDAITSEKIIAGAVVAGKIAAGAVEAEKIAADAVVAGKIAAGAVTSEKIEAGAIVADKIAADAVTSAKIIAGAITAEKIGAAAVTAAKIDAAAVTAEKIDAAAVTAEKLAADSVTAAKIEAGAVTAAKVAAGAISAEKIAAEAVTATKIAADAVEADKIAANAVTAGKIAAGAVEADKISASAVTADKIAANAVTSVKIDAEAITAAKIAADAIETDKIAANAITTGKIAAAAIGADQIAADAIVASKIAAGVITSDKIAAGTIQGDRIAANTITGGLIAASGVITSAAQIDDAVITNAKIANLSVDNAKIANLTIGTGKVADNAISTQTFSALSSAVLLPDTAAYQSILTITVTPVASTIVVYYSYLVALITGSSYTRNGQVRLLVNTDNTLTSGIVRDQQYTVTNTTTPYVQPMSVYTGSVTPGTTYYIKLVGNRTTTLGSGLVYVLPNSVTYGGTTFLQYLELKK